MIGSGLDEAYDAWRQREKRTETDKAFAAAKRLQRRLNDDLMGGEFTTLKWAKSYVQARSAAARLDIDRLEATQKFFRSFVVIAVTLAAYFLLSDHRPAFALGCGVLAILSYWRYIDQRWKMTELTYATAAILGAIKAQSRDDCVQAEKPTEDDKS